MSLTDPILQFQQTRAQVPFQPPTVCTAETFPILLAGVPALRRVPGLATLEDAGEDYFTSIPYCLSGEERQTLLNLMTKVTARRLPGEGRPSEDRPGWMQPAEMEED